MSTQIRHDLDWVTFIEPDEPCGALTFPCPNQAVWLGVYPYECEHDTIPYCDDCRIEIINLNEINGWYCSICYAEDSGIAKFVPLKGAQ